MNSAWYTFKTHGNYSESYLKFLRNLQNNSCKLVETRYLSFSNYLKNDKNVENCGCKVLFFYKKSDKFDDKFDTLVKRLGFFVKIHVSVKKCDF